MWFVVRRINTYMATEKITVNLPDGFDPQRHLRALEKRISEQFGDGFEISSINVKTRVATASRQASITEVSGGEENSFEVRLPRGTKPADGEKVATRLIADYPECEMTRFEPFLGKATLTKSSPETSRARGALAVALGVKPWDVQVSPRRDGGYDLELPRSYVPSKHDDKLTEVATAVIGHEGWYVGVNAAKLTASVIPSDPPTFPTAIPYPFGTLKKAPRDQLMLGLTLGGAGKSVGAPLMLDFETAPHTQISGTSGSGKSVLLNTMLTGVLAGGSEICIIDLPHKAVDFVWIKDYVRDAGWGCASLPAAVTSLTLVYKEGERRAKVLAQKGVTKWTELKPEDQFKPIFVLLDEVTGLIQLEDIPKGVPKDHPMVQEANQVNLLKATLLSFMKKISAEMRFVGIRMVLSSQVSSVNTGIPTSLRMNLANKTLLGSNPNSGNKRLALSDPASVPNIPENVKQDGQAARGVGVSEFEGQEPSVFKSFYAPTSDLRSALDGLGLRKTNQPEPTPAEIAKNTPSLDEDEGNTNYQDDYSSNKGTGERAPSGKLASTLRKEMGDEQDWAVDPETGKQLTGYAKANAARHASKVGGQKPKKPDDNNQFHQNEDGFDEFE